MPGNSIGKVFRVTTFGESHGPLVGVVIDGVPAGLPLSEEDIAFELSFRRPGRYLVSGRRERDQPKIVSGLFNGKTTGAPIAVIVNNEDVISSLYEETKYTPRPGHADLPYIQKYGFENWDYRGGGRASARETVSRVIAGTVAKKLLLLRRILIAGYLKSMGNIKVEGKVDFDSAICAKYSPVRAPSKDIENSYTSLLKSVFDEGDSVGGTAEFIVRNTPTGLGEPVFDKIKADLAKSLLSIPAVTGFEYGLGFEGAKMKGSEANDQIVMENGRPRYSKNSAGGILGGLTNGEDVIIRIAFKPTSSIRKPQNTVNVKTGESTTISVKGRHDPCVAIRGIAVGEAMIALTFADHMLRAGYVSLVKLEKDEVEEIERNWGEYKSLCQQALSAGSQ
ncbi:chorismate synthase [Sulfolobales archaeon HS-7]|nr:chorismate synthase [Sulfolobales archaeon HS-7]